MFGRCGFTRNPFMKRISNCSLTAALLLAVANLFAGEQNPQGIFNVLDFGAKGDGTNNDTSAIQQAVDDCVANGGGQVVLPGGKTFFTGAITLGSGVDFHLARGAVLKGS